MKRTVFTGMMVAMASASAAEFVPFDTFMEQTRTATAVDHMLRATSKVKSPAAFEEMRRHILNMYQGVQVGHSFVLGASYFDCVPIEQQPAARILGVEVAEMPPQSLIAAKPASKPSATKLDALGNTVGCEEKTVPMQRLTLEEMTRFSSLGEYFDKSTGSNIEPASDPTSGHKYAYMQQDVNNIGGTSTLNTWTPEVNTAWGEVMSLAQEWYVGGSGAATQTAEVGWQVQPGFWQTQDSVLFIYWTANHYDQKNYPGSKGGGCYNMKCAAFYQVSSETFLGASVASSVYGDAQYELSAEFYLYKGNWWLAIDGTWVGYYPGSIYHGGQMTKNAQMIQYGTETYATNGYYPGAGSSDWASKEWTYAAYQRDIEYFSTGGQAVAPTLQAQQPSPACYTTDGPYVSDTGSVFFYAGGPGGSGC